MRYLLSFCQGDVWLFFSSSLLTSLLLHNLLTLIQFPAADKCVNILIFQFGEKAGCVHSVCKYHITEVRLKVLINIK